MKDSGGAIMIGSKPTLIAVEGTPLRFLIMDAPRPNNLHLYIKECKKYNVTDVVRVCEPTYSKTDLIHAGIQLHEMPYPDGHSPPDEVLDRWLDLVHERFYASPIPSGSSPTIAVHCVAGLGRAPVLVSIALIEFQKMDPVEAVVLIRKHRRGAINDKQLNFLETYQRRYKKRGGGGGTSCCIIM